MTYNNSFQDRAAQAAEARKKALEQYRARPPVDEKLAAEREERAAVKAQKAADKKADREAADATAAAESAAKAAAAAPPTEAERKAARDARYAARKKRK